MTAPVRRPKVAADVPPHDLEAEECTLGACMLSKVAIESVLEERLVADDFYKPANAEVFGAIVMLHGKGQVVDAVTVSAELRKTGVLDSIGGLPYVHTLVSAPPTASAGVHYARIVKRESTLRNLANAAFAISDMVRSRPEDALRAVEDAIAEVARVADRAPKPESRGQLWQLEPWGAGWRADVIGGWKVEVSKIKEASSGDVFAEVSVSRGEGEARQRRRSLKLNIGAPGTVDSFTKTVSGLWRRTPFEWGLVLPEVFDAVIDAKRRPNPVVNLWDEDIDREATGFLLDPVAPFGDITVLFGDSGTRKSTILLLLLMAYATGQPVPGVALRRPRGPSVFFDFEWKKNPHVERCVALQVGMGWEVRTPVPGLHYVEMKRPLVDSLDEMKAILSETGAQLAGIDSLGLAARGKLRDEDVALATMGAIRELGVTTIATAHTTKEAANGDGKVKATIFGSTYWKASARATWEVKTTEDDEGDTQTVAMWQDKANRGKRKGKKTRPVAWDVTQVDDENAVPLRIEFASSGAGFRTKIEGDTKLADAIVEYLKGAPNGSTTKEIGLALGGRYSDNQIRAELNRHGIDVKTGEPRGRKLFYPVRSESGDSRPSGQRWKLL